ncbi:MAG: beta-hydroxyacyl-ACP dehydratase [bacterium]|nr:beta-hydroxyacyl-ACP dehydratase [bacterium]
MRWIHIDDIVELREGERARAARTVPANAEYLDRHFPGIPFVPQTLLIESMAQTAGILLGKTTRFERDVILAKIDRAEFAELARPGDALVIEAVLEDIREEGARASCRILRGDVEVGRATLVFALLTDRDADRLGARGFVFSGGLFGGLRPD